MKHYGLKILRQDGSSLNICGYGTVKYAMGRWQRIKNYGAYLAVGPLGICCGGIGPVVSVFEYDPRAGFVAGPPPPIDVRNYARVKRVANLKVPKKLLARIHRVPIMRDNKKIPGDVYFKYTRKIKAQLQNWAWKAYMRWLSKQGLRWYG